MPSGEQERRWTIRGRAFPANPNCSPYVFDWTGEALAHKSEVEVMPVSDHEAEVEKLKGEVEREQNAVAAQLAHKQELTTRGQQLLRAERERRERLSALLAEARAALETLIERVHEDRREPDKLLCHLASARRRQLDSTPTTEQGE